MSSSSSCRAASTDIPDPLSPPLPIIHRFWQVFSVTSSILTQLLYVCSSWLSCFCLAICGGPLEYINVTWIKWSFEDIYLIFSTFHIFILSVNFHFSQFHTHTYTHIYIYKYIFLTTMTLSRRLIFPPIRLWFHLSTP